MPSAWVAWRPPQIVRLAPHLTVHLAGIAIDALHDLRDETTRAATLRRLAPFLSPKLLPRALSVARTVTDPEERNATLVRLMPLLPLPLPSAALARIRALPNHAERVWLLRTIALRMDGPRQESLVREALDAARAIETPLERSLFLTDLARRLPSSLCHLTLERLRTIGDPSPRRRWAHRDGATSDRSRRGAAFLLR